MSCPDGVLPVTKMPVTTAAPASAPALRFQPFLGITRFGNLGSARLLRSMELFARNPSIAPTRWRNVERHNWAAPTLDAQSANALQALALSVVTVVTAVTVEQSRPAEEANRIGHVAAATLLVSRSSLGRYAPSFRFPAVRSVRLHSPHDNPRSERLIPTPSRAETKVN